MMQSTWNHFRLAELCDFQNGYAFKNSEYVEEGNGAFEIFRMGNIRKGGGFNPDGRKALVAREQAEKLRRFLLNEGDILMCMTDMKANPALLGHTAWMPMSGRYLVNQRVGRITVRRHDLLDQRFLYYYSNSADYIDYLRSHANSGVQVNLSTEVIRNSPIVCPALTVQRSIASILSSYDDLIENNTRRIAILEEMARRLYEEWFVRFRFPGHDQVRMVESELGLIPDGWSTERIGNLIEFKKGKKPDSVAVEQTNDLLRHLLIDALRGGSRAEYVSPEKMVGTRTDDTIMVMDGSGSSEVFIGHEGVIGSTLGRYRVLPESGIHPLWLFLFFISNLSEIKSKNIGAAIPHANKDFIHGIVVPVAKAEIADHFGNVTRPMFELISTLRKKNTNLRAQRDLLLPKLISGEVDVSAFPEAEAVAA